MDQRPNVIVVMTDQQRGDCLGIEHTQGHSRHPVLTPNLDRIAEDGVRFAQAYATSPVCIPARRSLLSGQWPSTHGMVGYLDGQEWHPEHTLPSVLREAGYQTQLVGRSMHQHPRRKRFGYDEMVISPADYSRWAERHIDTDLWADPWYSTGVMHNDITARAWPHAEELHHTNWASGEARRFLARRDPTVPYFLTLSYLLPHPPCLPPAEYLERYRDRVLPTPVIGDWAPADAELVLRKSGASPVRLDPDGVLFRTWQAAYYASINHIDDQIRRVLHRIPGAMEGPDPEDTIIVFTADHGDMLGDHGQYAKSEPYEGSARVPLIIRAPRRYGLDLGARVEEPVALEDIMPTVLDLCGIDIPDSVDGTSLVPLMTGERSSLDRAPLHLECAPSFHALTDGRWKYVWLLPSGREQLFDLDRDRDECHDLADSHPQVLAQWRARLIAELSGRPEGFVRDDQLVPEATYRAMMPASVC